MPSSLTLSSKLWWKWFSEASASLAQKAYEQAQQAAGDHAEAADTGESPDDGVVDAEFEEVDDDKKAS